jgi:hypothetical protein
LNTWVVCDVRCLVLDYGKDGKDGKYGNGLALRARWVFSTDIFCPTEIAESTEIYFFSARIFLFKLSHGLHRCFHIWITEKDGNDGNLLLYYMIVEGGCRCVCL